MDTLCGTADPETQQEYHPSILAAIALARKKMNRYYSLTDDAAPYRIAMGKSLTHFLGRVLMKPQVLHPGLKLEYFRRQQWEKAWIEQAETMVREEYAASYEKATVSEEMSDDSSPFVVCGISS
jgi:hypothetical protein